MEQSSWRFYQHWFCLCLHNLRRTFTHSFITVGLLKPNFTWCHLFSVLSPSAAVHRLMALFPVSTPFVSVDTHTVILFCGMHFVDATLFVLVQLRMCLKPSVVFNLLMNWACTVSFTSAAICWLFELLITSHDLHFEENSISWLNAPETLKQK